MLIYVPTEARFSAPDTALRVWHKEKKQAIINVQLSLRYCSAATHYHIPTKRMLSIAQIPLGLTRHD